MADYASAPLSWGSWAEWLKRVSLVVNGLLLGQSNNVGQVTLAVAPATTTVITNPRITARTVLLLSPTTATAAAALATLYAVATNGSVTITHAANAAADQTFGYALVG